MRVLVTFLSAPAVESAEIDLRSRDIDETLAAELSARLQPFADAWSSPAMDIL